METATFWCVSVYKCTGTYDQTIYVVIKDIFILYNRYPGIPLRSLEQDAVLKLYLKKIILSYEKRKRFYRQKTLINICAATAI
jgi:hypothetical protein